MTYGTSLSTVADWTIFLWAATWLGAVVMQIVLAVRGRWGVALAQAAVLVIEPLVLWAQSRAFGARLGSEDTWPMMAIANHSLAGSVVAVGTIVVALLLVARVRPRRSSTNDAEA